MTRHVPSSDPDPPPVGWTSQAELPEASTRRTDLRVHDRTLAVYEHGPDILPAAVIAHGVGSSGRFVVDAFGEPVAAAGYRLVTYDLRGHGESGPARTVAEHDLGGHTADLAAIAGAVQARIVGGVSLGAHAAATWAASGRAELDGVLLCLPAWTGRADPGTGPHAAVADDVRARGVEGALRRAVADEATPAWIAALLERDWQRADEGSLRAALLALDGGSAPTEDDLARIRAPAGVVGWPEDPGHPLEEARRWAAVVPRARLQVTTLEAVGERPIALGEAAVRALLAAIRADRG